MRFSVVIATYNGERHITQTVDSVLAQSFKNYELFVIDDGSTDGTAQLLAAYGSRITVMSQRNAGPELARNAGVARAKGEYLVFLDHDDLLSPYALEVYDRVIRWHSSPPLVMGAIARFADGDPVPLPHVRVGGIEVSVYADFLSKDLSMGTSASLIVIRKPVFEEVGGARNCTLSSWRLNDFHLLLKAGTQTPCVVVRTPITVAYRLHGGNVTRDYEGMVRAALSLIEFERQGRFPGGSQRRLARHKWIGSVAWHWIANSIRGRKPRLAWKLLVQGTPMLARALPQKVMRRVRGPSPQPVSVLQGEIEVACQSDSSG